MVTYGRKDIVELPLHERLFTDTPQVFAAWWDQASTDRAHELSGCSARLRRMRRLYFPCLQHHTGHLAAPAVPVAFIQRHQHGGLVLHHLGLRVGIPLPHSDAPARV